MTTTTNKRRAHADTRFIKTRLHELGIKQKDLSVIWGCDRSLLNAKINDRTTMTADDIVRFADLLGCTTDEVLGRSTERRYDQKVVEHIMAALDIVENERRAS